MTALARFRTGDSIRPGLLAWERLRAGSRCETWLAWSVPLWSHVVVRLPRADLVADPETARELGDEARLLRGLAHPGLQRLLHDGHQDPLPHLVLEFVEGPTLDLVVEDDGVLAPGEVARIGMQVAACLHYLHCQGLAHLQLEPGSVVLRQGRAVLVGLGHALPIGTLTGVRPSEAARDYAAPEQCEGGRAEPRLDLFALGVVLSELATGERPPVLPVASASVPAPLERAIESLLEPDPTRRPQTALAAMRLLAASLPLGEEAAWPDFVSLLLALGPGSAEHVLDGHLAPVLSPAGR